MVANNAARLTLSKGFFEINGDMVQILLIIEVLFTLDSKVEICSVVPLPVLNPACSSEIIYTALGFSLFKMPISLTLLG